MYKLFFSAFTFLSLSIVSIYSLSIATTDDGTFRFNDYRNKKILIVNTATGNVQSNQQLIELQQLYQQNQDSLIIIAFPTNSFGREPGTNQQIKALMQGTYGVTFPIAAKSYVRGDTANVIYQWLGSLVQNEVGNLKVRKDYQKFLIDGSGNITGIFDSSVSPMSSTILNAIHN